MRTKIIDLDQLTEWVILAGKPGEQIARLLESLTDELQIAAEIVGRAADIARIREYREGEDPCTD